MKKFSYVHGYYRNAPEKKPDPIRQELQLGKECVSDLAEKLSDLRAEDLRRIEETY